ncbi:MAG: hypothetical protein ACT4PM_10280 [Gemmatimonadales bacterium]
MVREGSAFLQGRLVWSFTAADRVLIRPDVQYGVLPAGAILEGPTVPLESGRIYHVLLETLADVGGITGHGTATFRP